MAAAFAGTIEVSRRAGCPLYCAGFGVIGQAPLPVREARCRTIIPVFEEPVIDWGCKGRPGIVDGDRQTTGVAAL